MSALGQKDFKYRRSDPQAELLYVSTNTITTDPEKQVVCQQARNSSMHL